MAETLESLLAKGRCLSNDFVVCFICIKIYIILQLTFRFKLTFLFKILIDEYLICANIYICVHRFHVNISPEVGLHI